MVTLGHETTGSLVARDLVFSWLSSSPAGIEMRAALAGHLVKQHRQSDLLQCLVFIGYHES